MKNTLRDMVRMCEEIRRYMRDATAEEFYGLAGPEVDRAVGCVQCLGSAAANLPEEQGVIFGYTAYLRSVGLALQQADREVAFTFCKYDMPEFLNICNSLLEDGR